MTELEKNNIQLVKDVFAAIGKGDINYVLNQLANDIDWQSPATGSTSGAIPWARPRYSREEVGAFFKELLEKVKLVEMKPITYTAQDDRVIVEGYTHGIVNSTGREYTSNWLMAITVENGKCIRMRHYYDTADVSKAFPVEVRKAA